MKDSNRTFWGYVARHGYLIVLALFALWMCLGIFPLVCYEADSMEVIYGCDLLNSQGWSLPPIHSYEYRMQPLIYITVVAIKKCVPALTCEQIYCLVTAISSFIFLIGSVEFVRYITRRGRLKILIAAILLPEMYAIAMYPNSAIPAAACFIWAFICLIQRNYLVAAFLMCLAPLFRVDVVTVYPAIFPLFIHQGKTSCTYRSH